MYLSRSVTKLVLVLAVLCCGAMPSNPTVAELCHRTVAQVSDKEAPFLISNQTAKLACVGEAAIRGSNNELTIMGQCSSLDLAGSNNKITVTLDCNGGKAAIRGSNNELTITGKCSELDLTGANNKIIGTLDCDGGKIAIGVSNNAVTITGKCSDLDLGGSVNRVMIDFGQAEMVNISGSVNAIVWSSADGKPPTINDVGITKQADATTAMTL